VRLAPFWAEWLPVWLAQGDAQFTLTGISSEQTKFYYVISQLDHKYAKEVENVITVPPERHTYITLRTKLVRQLSPSGEQRVRQLLTLEEMGESKPSQFMRHVRSLPPNVSDDIFCSIWSGRLPSNVQVILAGQPEGDLDAAARCVDAIFEVAP
jgi:hypothetical protein